MKQLSAFDAQSANIINLATGVNLLDAANMTNLGLYLPLAGGTLTGALTVAGTAAGSIAYFTVNNSSGAVGTQSAQFGASVPLFIGQQSGTYNEIASNSYLGGTSRNIVTGGYASVLQFDSNTGNINFFTSIASQAPNSSWSMSSTPNFYIDKTSSGYFAGGVSAVNGALSGTLAVTGASSFGGIIISGVTSTEYGTGEVNRQITSSATGAGNNYSTWYRGSTKMGTYGYSDTTTDVLYYNNLLGNVSINKVTISTLGALTVPAVATFTTALFSNAAVGNTIVLTDTTLDATTTAVNTGIHFYKATTSGSTRDVGYIGGGSTGVAGMNIASWSSMNIGTVNDGQNITINAAGNSGIIFLKTYYGIIQATANTIQIYANSSTTSSVTISSGSAAAVTINGLALTKTTTNDSVLTSSGNIFLNTSVTNGYATIMPGTSSGNNGVGGIDWNWYYGGGSGARTVLNSGYVGMYSFNYSAGTHLFGVSTASQTAGTTTSGGSIAFNNAALSLDPLGNGIFSGALTATAGTFSGALAVTGATSLSSTLAVTGALTAKTASFSASSISMVSLIDTVLDATTTNATAGIMFFKTTTAGSTRQIGNIGATNNDQLMSVYGNNGVSIHGSGNMSIISQSNGGQVQLTAQYGGVVITSATSYSINLNGVLIAPLGASVSMPGTLSVTGATSATSLLLTTAGVAATLSLTDSTLDATTANPSMGIAFFKATTSGSTRSLTTIGYTTSDSIFDIIVPGSMLTQVSGSGSTLSIQNKGNSGALSIGTTSGPINLISSAGGSIGLQTTSAGVVSVNYVQFSNSAAISNVSTITASGVIKTAGAISAGFFLTPILTATDAAYAGGGGVLILPVITANRIANFTYNTGNVGATITIINKNTSSFTWTSTATVVDAYGNTLAAFANLTIYELTYDGTQWNITGTSTLPRTRKVLAVTLGSTYTPTFIAGDILTGTLGSNCTIAIPTNIEQGSTVRMGITNGSTVYTVTWTGYKTPGGQSSLPQVTQTAGAIDYFDIFYDGANYILTKVLSAIA